MSSSMRLKRDIDFAGGELHLGASQRAFRFDNEKPPCKTRLTPFAIDAAIGFLAGIGMQFEGRHVVLDRFVDRNQRQLGQG